MKEEENEKKKIECRKKIEWIFIRGLIFIKSYKKIYIITNYYLQVSTILQILTFYNTSPYTIIRICLIKILLRKTLFDLLDITWNRIKEEIICYIPCLVGNGIG